jgi:hypothetical protein
MVPSAINLPVVAPILPSIKDTKEPVTYKLPIPEPTRRRLEAANVDISNGYTPLQPLYLQDIEQIRNEPREFVDAGSRADPEKKALFNAAKQIIHLTNHIGTEIVGLQLKDLTDKQKDELGLLIAERSVVFFRDQDLLPQQQRSLGEYYGEVEVHVSTNFSRKLDLLLIISLQPQGSHVPGIPGVSVIWPNLFAKQRKADFRHPGDAGIWHTLEYLLFYIRIYLTYP